VSPRVPGKLICISVLIGGLASGVEVSRASAEVTAGDRPSLYVFLQLDVKSSVLEKTLQAQLSDLSVTVFGRFRDFQDAVAGHRPDAVVAISPLFELEHSKVTLQGTRGGKDWEAYTLVSVGPQKGASLSGKTVGVVDILGREGTQTFAAGLLKTPDIKTKRVAKLEDLLPLLEFSAADAILIPSSAQKRLTERTRLPLVTRDLPDAHVGLPAVSVLNVAARDRIVRSVHALDTLARGMLGVDGWSAR
jgi:hypothetical protein